MNRRLIYPGGSFVAGFVLMAFEIISSRIIAPLVGNSLYSWAAVIGVTLLGLSVGAGVGGVIADGSKTRVRLIQMFLLSSFFISIVPLVAMYLSITETPGGIMVSSIMYAAVLFFPASCILGTIQPIILKEYTLSYEKLGRMYGMLSMAWSFGSILGVVITGFVLISFFSVTTIVSMLAFVSYACALAFLKNDIKLLKILILVFIGISLSSFFVQYKKNNPADVVVYQKDTPYYQVKIVDFMYPSFGFTRSLFLDYDQHSSETEKILPFAYTNSFPIFGLLMKDPKKILVLGGGAYTLPKELSSYYKTHVDVFEIDPDIPDIVKKYFGYSTSSIITTTGDARTLLRKSDKRYDLIFGDVYNSFIGIPYHTATKEYYEITKKHLVPGGVYAMSFASPEEGDDQDFLYNMVATFKDVYPNYYIFSFTSDKKSLGSILLVGVNADVSQHVSNEDFLKRIGTLKEYSFLADFLRDTNDFSLDTAIVFTDDYVPVENQMQSITEQYFKRYSSFLLSLYTQKRVFTGVVQEDQLFFERK